MKVFHGPFCRLEEKLAARVQDLRRRSPLAPIAVVCPSRRMADRVQRALAERLPAGLIGIHFHTFYSLALAVLEDAGLPDKKLLGDPLFHDRAIDLLLDKKHELAARFGGKGRPKALAAALRSSVRDLIDAGVAKRDVREHLTEGFADGPSAWSRLEALLELKDGYESWLERSGVISPSGLTRLAAEAADDSACLKGFSELLYYGFYDLTGLQLEFFERVTAEHPSSVFFPYVREHPAFRFAKGFFELKLHQGGAPEELDKTENGALSGALERLFSAEQAPAGEPSPGIRIFNASGARDEVWQAAKEIARLVREENARFDEIGVVARTLEPYRAAIIERFEAEAIPYDLETAGPLKRYPAAKRIIDLLNLKRRDFPARATADLLQSPYFRRQETLGKNGDQIARKISRAIERLHIHAGWLVWQGKLEFAAREAEADEKDERAPALEKAEAKALLKWLESVNESLSGAAQRTRPWADWRDHALAVIESSLALPSDASAVEAQAWEDALGAVRSLAGFEPLGAVTWEFFLDTATEKLEAASLESPSRRGVRVLASMDARGDSFRHLFLLGLQEGLFPRQVREDPLLRDDARQKLRHPGGYWIAPKLAGHEEERLLFYLNAAAARERLYCVYSRSDEDGRAANPSLYLRELCRAAGVSLRDAAVHVPRPMLSKLARLPVEDLSPRELSIKLASESGDPSPVLRALGDEAGAAALQGALARAMLINAPGSAGVMDGLIGPPRRYLERISSLGLSPSSLDDFGSCPFQFYAKKVLRLDDERDSERGDFSSTQRGKIYHEILERFYKALKRKAYWTDRRGAIGVELTDAIESVFAQHDWRGLGVYPVMWKAARRAVERNLKAFVEWDLAEIGRTGLIPTLFEAELSGPLEIAPLPPGVDALKFRGIADRVDVDEANGAYQIVDYKTHWGRSRKVDRLVLSGRLHQPPIYAELAKAALPPGPQWKLIGAHIYSLEDSPEETGQERLQPYRAELWDDDRPLVLNAIGEYAGWIAAGRFPIRPEDGEFSHCGWCSFSAICRKSHKRSRERAAALVQASELQRINDRKRAS